MARRPRRNHSPAFKAKGYEVGRLRVSTLMQKMGIAALYRRPKTSTPAPGHKIYPSLLRGLTVRRPGRVWAMDIAYLPMARGLVYIATVLDWFSRKVLAWHVSITREAEFCIEALEEALARHGRPEILNTDQGSQFTSLDCVQVPKDAESAISMDGKGAWRDKAFVERLWRRVTYEEIDRHADAKVPEARASIGRYLAFYNSTRPHSSPDRADARSGVDQRAAANPGSGLTQTEIHLAMAPTLFKQSEPPLLTGKAQQAIARHPASPAVHAACSRRLPPNRPCAETARWLSPNRPLPLPAPRPRLRPDNRLHGCRVRP